MVVNVITGAVLVWGVAYGFTQFVATDRAAYPLSPHEINAILSAEDAAPDGRPR